ncbi:MAG: integrase core domain-containing protein [Polyangiaceae bacterium]|nr:integrase core domain-containing protein [Polyangiaceae bacterium]
MRISAPRSFSRPRVSDDNAFSEAQFKTLKYQPDYPVRFTGEDHARGWLQPFFGWHNDEHHHAGLALFTPADVFHGRVEQSPRGDNRRSTPPTLHTPSASQTGHQSHVARPIRLRSTPSRWKKAAPTVEGRNRDAAPREQRPITSPSAPLTMRPSTGRAGRVAPRRALWTSVPAARS